MRYITLTNGENMSWLISGNLKRVQVLVTMIITFPYNDTIEIGTTRSLSTINEIIQMTANVQDVSTIINKL